MTDREKLYFLIQDSKESRWFPNNEEILKLADHLVKNGATVQMPNNSLTLSEIKQEKFVWIEPLKDWAKVTPWGLLFFGTEDSRSWNECDDLGIWWHAYRYKPNED